VDASRTQPAEVEKTKKHEILVLTAMAITKMTNPLTSKLFIDWSSDLQYIISDCHISISNFEQLASKLNVDPQYARLNGFLDHLLVQYYFTVVTQLAKLFCDGQQHQRLERFMNRIGEMPTPNFVLKHFDENKIDPVHKGLNRYWKSTDEMHFCLRATKARLKATDKIVKRLKECRNQVIAHTDPLFNRENAEINAPSITELKTLAVLAGDVYNTIQIGLGRGCFCFDVTNSWDIDSIFQGWTGHMELRRLTAELDRMGGKGILNRDRATGELTMEPMS